MFQIMKVGLYKSNGSMALGTFASSEYQHSCITSNGRLKNLGARVHNIFDKQCMDYVIRKENVFFVIPQSNSVE